jgi:phage baseplate assembly protein W
MAPSARDFLGLGWKFPLQVTPGGKIAQARHEQRIEESIYLILSTARGERVMLPDFGCGMHELVFAPNNSLTQSLVVQNVRQALVTMSPVDVLSVSAEAEPKIPPFIWVDYRARLNNAMGTWCTPYIREGTTPCRWPTICPVGQPPHDDIMARF